jgi:uncharacterized protein (TIGR02145 family)
MKTAHSTNPILPILLTGVIGVQAIFTLSCSGGDDSRGNIGLSSESNVGVQKEACIIEMLYDYTLFTLNDIAGGCGANKDEVLYLLYQFPSLFGTCNVEDLDFDKPIEKIKEKCGGGSSSSSAVPGGTFKDSRDGKTYKWVEIGSQVWMAENLNYNAPGSKCGGNGKLKDENTENCDKYGRLYNWATAMNGSKSSNANPSGIQGVCPTGWHLPSDAEGTTLTNYVGSPAGTKLKSKSGWSNGNGTDDYGFSALLGGFGSSEDGFSSVGSSGIWWSATEYDASIAYRRNMSSGYTNVDRGYFYKTYLYSVRCVKDDDGGKPSSSSSSAEPGSLIPCPNASTVSVNAQGVGSVTCGGETYKTVKIGEQVWMARNLNYNFSGSKCYDNDPANCTKYGRLYDLEAAKSACPSGWNLPSDSDWDALMTAVGGESTAGTKLKATSGWNSNGNGTDIYGFSSLPGGGGLSSGSFFNVGGGGLWWSATEGSASYAYYRYMGYDDASVSRINYDKTNLYSVRCVKD